MYTSLLTSVKSAGRCQKDKGCLEQHELTEALPVDHGSTPDFFWSQTDRKKTIFLSYFHERSLWAGFKILNQNQRQFLPQRCYASALLWCRQTSSDDDITARALATPHINNVYIILYKNPEICLSVMVRTYSFIGTTDLQCLYTGPTCILWSIVFWGEKVGQTASCYGADISFTYMPIKFEQHLQHYPFFPHIDPLLLCMGMHA